MVMPHTADWALFMESEQCNMRGDWPGFHSVVQACKLCLYPSIHPALMVNMIKALDPYLRRKVVKVAHFHHRRNPKTPKPQSYKYSIGFNNIKNNKMNSNQEDEESLSQPLIAYKQIPRVDMNDDDLNIESIIASNQIGGESKLEEPLSHIEAKSLCMRIFPKLAEITNLTIEEIEVFYNLKLNQSQSYDQANESHEVIYREIKLIQQELRNLGILLLGSETLQEITENGMKSKEWKKFGF